MAKYGEARQVWPVVDGFGGARYSRRGLARGGTAWWGRQGTDWIGGVRRGEDRQAWSGMDGIGKARISRHLTRRNLWMQNGNY